MRAMDVRAWLFSHGFEARRGRLVSEYEGHEVWVQVGPTGGRSWIDLDGSEHTLRKFNHANLMIDDTGMLLGVGLRSFFLERMRAGAGAPSWFPYDRVEAKPDPTGRAAIVIDWLRSRGFTEREVGCFDARYRDTCVSVTVTGSHVSTLIEPASDPVVKQHVSLDSIWIGKDRMLRGAGLAGYFLDRVRAGGPIPSWFGQRFIRKRIDSCTLAAAPKA